MINKRPRQKVGEFESSWISFASDSSRFEDSRVLELLCDEGVDKFHGRLGLVGFDASAGEARLLGLPLL